MTPLQIDNLPPVSLSELVDEAELLTRFDRKYLLDRATAAALLRSFDPRTRVLTIDGRRGFRYESVYFDTPDLLSYRQAALARRHRFKVRTRCYLDSDLAFLEVKVRGDREVTVKDRLPYHPEDRGRLTGTGRDYAESTLANRGMEGSVAGRLSPTLVTRYTRVTLLPPEPGVRVTIDTDLSWVSPREEVTAGDGPHNRPYGELGRHIRQPEGISDGKWQHSIHDPRDPGLTLPDLVIVETKAGSRPSGIDRLLWNQGHRPLSVSKYGTGLAALRQDLPDNKWARILRRHFQPAGKSASAA